MQHVEERFWSKVDKNDPVPEQRPDLGPCWLWTASTFGGGYAQFSVQGRKTYGHRFAYELLVGPIPEGLQLDHLCRVRNCVNPDHLEPVTHAENILRGFSVPAIRARKLACASGHAFDELNTYRDRHGHRSCRRCKAEMQSQRRARRAA